MVLHFTSFYLVHLKSESMTDGTSDIISNAASTTSVSVGQTIAVFFRNLSLLAPGVVILFALSGFLAAASMKSMMENNSNSAIHSQLPFPNNNKYTFTWNQRFSFLKKKCLRIYPQLWFATILNLILLFIVTPSRIDRSILPWILAQLVGIAYTPAAFKDFATGSLNGTLWTIFVQLQLFVIGTLVYPIIAQPLAKPQAQPQISGADAYNTKTNRVRNKITSIGVLLFVAAIANVICKVTTSSSSLFSIQLPGYVNKAIERSFVPYFIWFLIGMIVFEYKDRLIPILTRFWLIGLIVLIGISCLLIPDYGYYCGIITGILTPLITLGLGYCLPSKRLPDITYEMFLLHWPILNVIIYYDLYSKINCGVLFVGFLGVTIVLSIIGKCFLSQITNTKSN